MCLEKSNLALRATSELQLVNQIDIFIQAMPSYEGCEVNEFEPEAPAPTGALPFKMY